MDMEYVYGTLSHTDGEDPVDYAAFQDNPMELIVVAPEVKTGRAKYFDNPIVILHLILATTLPA